ncbi:hypothetical protein U1Q18_005929 [Sarracenia purpurea var. burkii]
MGMFWKWKRNPLLLGYKAVVDVGAISEDEDEEVEDDDGDSYSGGEDIEIALGEENPVVIGTEDGGGEETRGSLNRSDCLEDVDLKRNCDLASMDNQTGDYVGKSSNAH